MLCILLKTSINIRIFVFVVLFIVYTQNKNT